MVRSGITHLGNIFGEWLAVMKKDIHPDYFDTDVTCGCGNKFTTRSTRKELKVDICSNCHPFYTGKLKYVDTAGRIEKFQKKFSSGGYASLQKPAKKKKSKARGS
jgi:large subunit ribosomal protein L31